MTSTGVLISPLTVAEAVICRRCSQAISPLHDPEMIASFARSWPCEPDLILVYGNGAQVMRLLVAALWRRGGRLHSSFSGRVDCADAVISTMQTGEPQVVLPCNGDRIFAQTQDDEMAFTIPATRIDEITEGLERSQRAGVRYPIPSWLRYTGGFPASYNKMEELWRGEEKED